MTQGERITALEVENRQLRVEVQSLRDEIKSVNSKLDELLAFKAKGQGAFWLATTLFGTSFAVFISLVVSWFK